MLVNDNRISMDDDAEEVVVHQTLFSHMKIISHFLRSLPLNAASMSCLGKCVYRYLVKPESVVALAALIIIILVLHSNEPWCQRLCFSRLLKKRSGLIVNPIDFLNDHETWNYDSEGVGVFALRGKRPHMEDRFSVVHDKDSGISLYGIFDGHGGEYAAEYVVSHLFSALLKKLKSATKNGYADETSKENNSQTLIKEFAQLLTEEILAIDVKLLVKVKAARNVAGTTALVAAVYKNQLIVANVGDSRGVICDAKGNAVPLSFDHKPQQLKEHRRIKEAGGFITFNGVWRVAGVLATSRALGDFPLKDRNLIIAEPDILTFNLDDLKPQFMILATDGLWDAFTNEDAVAFMRDHIDEPFSGAKTLAFQAYKKGSLDNITVLAVNFKNFSSSV